MHADKKSRKANAPRSRRILPITTHLEVAAAQRLLVAFLDLIFGHDPCYNLCYR